MVSRIMIVLRRLAAVLLIFPSFGLDEPGRRDGSAAEREPYARYALSNRGDAARGRAVFEDAKAACSRCHRVKGAGGDAGPTCRTSAASTPAST